VAEGVHRNDGGDPAPGDAVPGLAVSRLNYIAKIISQPKGIEAQGSLLRIDEMGDGTAIVDDICRGDKCQCWDQDFVPGTDTGKLKGDVQGRRTVDNGYRAGSTRIVSQFLLETVDELSYGRNPSGIETLFDKAPFIAAKNRLM
jgi:hypothetical protein